MTTHNTGEYADSDDQELELVGSILSIENGNNVDLSGLGGVGVTQTLTFLAGVISISGGNSINIKECELTDAFGVSIGCTIIN